MSGAQQLIAIVVVAVCLASMVHAVADAWAKRGRDDDDA